MFEGLYKFLRGCLYLIPALSADPQYVLVLSVLHGAGQVVTGPPGTRQNQRWTRAAVDLGPKQSQFFAFRLF